MELLDVLLTAGLVILALFLLARINQREGFLGSKRPRKKQKKPQKKKKKLGKCESNCKATYNRCVRECPGKTSKPPGTIWGKTAAPLTWDTLAPL